MDIETSSGSNHSLSESNSPGSIVPIIQNIVSTVNLGCKLDLASIALRARNTEYRPKRFTAVVMRIRDPKTTALIFGSGKLVCTGAKTEQDSKIAMRKYARIIQKLGFSVKMSDFKIQNIVGSCDVRFSIRLETFVFDSHVDGYSCYEPEVFPGLIHKMNDPRVSILIFASGKVVITGAKVKEDVFTAFRNIYPVIKQHKRLPNT